MIFGLIFISLAAIIHIYIWILESFLWTSPKTIKIFGMSKEQAVASKQLAFNQGFYNLFLALIALAGVIAYSLSNSQIGYVLVLAGAGSMVLAGLLLILSDTSKLRPALIQITAPIIGIILLALL